MKDVTEIIEIVFESVSPDDVLNHLSDVLSKSILKSYNVSSDFSDIDLRSNSKLKECIKKMPDGAIYFNFLNYQLDNILLAKVGYQILKYNNVYDLSLSIEEKEISQKTSILNLKYRVDKLAEKLKSKIFYCGYEPAIDEETRMFSSFEMGPLKGW